VPVLCVCSMCLCCVSVLCVCGVCLWCVSVLCESGICLCYVSAVCACGMCLCCVSVVCVCSMCLWYMSVLCACGMSLCYVSGIAHKWDMTHSNVWHDCIMCVTWVTSQSHNTHVCVCECMCVYVWYANSSHGSVTWRFHIYAIPLPHVWHDSGFIPSSKAVDQYTCVTWPEAHTFRGTSRASYLPGLIDTQGSYLPGLICTQGTWHLTCVIWLGAHTSGLMSYLCKGVTKEAEAQFFQK